MKEEIDGIDQFERQIASLESTLNGATSLTAAFDGELKRMETSLSNTHKQVDVMSRGVSSGLRRAFDGMVFDGMKLEDALKKVSDALINTAYSAAVKPVMNHVGDLVSNGVSSIFGGMLEFEKGGSFAQGRVMPFAKGGVVAQPTTFPMRGGTGLMGEAGPEAIMPLSRGADGRLGIAASGGGQPMNVVMNISTPNAESFRRSQGQIAHQMSRAMTRGQRNK